MPDTPSVANGPYAMRSTGMRNAPTAPVSVARVIRTPVPRPRSRSGMRRWKIVVVATSTISAPADAMPIVSKREGEVGRQSQRDRSAAGDDGPNDQRHAHAAPQHEGPGGDRADQPADADGRVEVAVGLVAGVEHVDREDDRDHLEPAPEEARHQLDDDEPAEGSKAQRGLRRRGGAALDGGRCGIGGWRSLRRRGRLGSISGPGAWEGPQDDGDERRRSGRSR